MPRLGAALRLIAGIALLTSSTAACTRASEVSATDSVTTSVEAARVVGGMLVRVEMFNGDVSVDPSTDGSIRAVVTRTGVGFSAGQAATARDAVEVTSGTTATEAFVRARYTPDPESPGNNAAAAVVTVPPGSAVIVLTSNGAVRMAGIAGPVKVHTSNGAVEVGGATAGLAITTSNGSITTNGGGGLMILATSNASISVGGATAARLDLHASNGEVSFAGSLTDGTSTIESSNRPLKVTLPADATFAFAAETSNAVVTVDGFATSGGGSAGASARGVVGTDPAVRLNLRTSNAAISICASR